MEGVTSGEFIILRSGDVISDSENNNVKIADSEFILNIRLLSIGFFTRDIHLKSIQVRPVLRVYGW